MKDVSFCFEKKWASDVKTTAFHPGPVLPPSGEGPSFYSYEILSGGKPEPRKCFD